MPIITPSLWFNDNLEEAAEYYTSVFPNSSIEDPDIARAAAATTAMRGMRRIVIAELDAAVNNG